MYFPLATTSLQRDEFSSPVLSAVLESGLALESCSAGKHYTCGLVRESGLQS
jgi:hypothetical protein